MKVEVLYEMLLRASPVTQGRAVDGYRVQRGKSGSVRGSRKGSDGLCRRRGIMWVVAAALEEYRERGLVTMLYGFLEGWSIGDEVLLTAACENFRALVLFVRISWRAQRCL